MLQRATGMPGNMVLCAETVIVRLFGRMEATQAYGESFLPRSRKSRAILAVLALAKEAPVSRTALIDLLWPLRGRVQAQASLRQCVHELRENLLGVGGLDLLSIGNHVLLKAPGMWLDAHYIGNSAFLAPQVGKVLRGPLMSDLFGLSKNFDDWIVAQQKAIEPVVSKKADAFLKASRDPRETIQVAEALIAYDPSFESAWCALAQAHATLGNADAAVEVYQRCLAEVRRSGGRLAFSAETLLSPYLPRVADETNATPPIIGEVCPPIPFSHLETRGLAVPCRSVRLAIAPMRAIGEATQDMAMSIDWQILSGLRKFDQFSCVPIRSAPDDGGSPSDLATGNFDFLLEGVMERWLDSDQFSIRLRDLHLNGEVFWDHRLRRPISSVYCMQEEVAPVLASRVAAEVIKRQAMLLKRTPENALSLPQLLHKATHSINRLNRQSLAEADQILSEAIRRDHRHPAPFAWYAYAQVVQLGQGWIPKGAGTLRCIGELVDRSLALRPDDASVLSIAGHVLAFTQDRLEEGLDLQEQALEKNPNLPSAWLFSALAHSYAGQHEEAIFRIGRAKLLSPADPQAYFMETALGLAHLLNGDPTRALLESRSAIRLNPNFSSPYKIALAALGYHDPSFRDQNLLKRLLQMEPSSTVGAIVARSPLRRSADKARFAEGLILAGLAK